LCSYYYSKIKHCTIWGSEVGRGDRLITFGWYGIKKSRFRKGMLVIISLLSTYHECMKRKLPITSLKSKFEHSTYNGVSGGFYMMSGLRFLVLNFFGKLNNGWNNVEWATTSSRL